MKQIYAEYFQKSKVFLYPLLEIKKGVQYVPIETYISWNGEFNNKFYCLYHAEDNERYRKFELDFLTSHKLFEDYFKLEDDVHLYVYDYSKFKHDLDMFKIGKYSKFTLKTKQKISDFFGDVGAIADYIQSYINPESYHETYAEHLGVALDTIEKVYELCSKPDLEKEDLKISATELDLFKNNSLSLSTNKPK